MIQQIVELIRTQQRFLIISHEGPDGDALGSTLGLAISLREMGKDVVAFNIDSVPELLTFLPKSEQIVQELPSDASFDVAFVLDAGDISRAGIPVSEYCSTLVNIDHHPHSEFGDICYLDTNASATSLMIVRILDACGHHMSLEAAKCLYTGILSDTGSFRYSSASEEAFIVAGRLVGMGVDTWDVASRLYESLAPERMRLLGSVLPTLEISACGRYASVVMSEEMLHQSGATEEYADGFVNYPRAVRGVEVALFYRQLDADTYKVSFRSRGKIDVGGMARSLGGGGHHNAAGATVTGSLEQVKAKVATLLDQSVF